MRAWVIGCTAARICGRIRTNWCTVPARDKIRLVASGHTTEAAKAAYAECRALGLHIFEEKGPWDWEAQRDLAEYLGGRLYTSPDVDQTKLKAILRRLKEAK